TITEVNGAPTGAKLVMARVSEVTPSIPIPFVTLLGNDSKGPANESGQNLTIISVGSAVGGTVAISGTDVIFTPTADYNGPASFRSEERRVGKEDGAPCATTSTDKDTVMR